MGLPMWGSEGVEAHKTSNLSQSSFDRTVPHPATDLSFQESLLSSVVSDSVARPIQSASGHRRGASTSRIFGPRDPQIVSSSQSVDPSSSVITRANGRTLGVTEMPGARGVLRPSDDRDEQMLSLEEFLAESSRATAERVEEETLNRAIPARLSRSDTRTIDTIGTEDRESTASDISGNSSRQTPRPWQSSTLITSNSRRQLPRSEYRLSVLTATSRATAEAAAVENWNNFARDHGAHSRAQHAHIHTQARSLAADGSAGFHDIVQQIRDIGAHQDRVLEGIHDEPRPREPTQSLIARAYRARMGLLEAFDAFDQEFERLRADAQARRDNLHRDLDSSRPMSELLQRERHRAMRLEEEMEQVDDNLRNLHRISSNYSSESATRLLSYIHRSIPPSAPSQTVTFSPPYRTVRPGASATRPSQNEASAALDGDSAYIQHFTPNLLSEYLSARRPWVGSSSEPRENSYDPDFLLRFRNAFGQLDRPGATVDERLQMQLHIQNLFDRRNNEYSLGSSSVEIRSETMPRPLQPLTSEGRQRRARHITGNYNDPVRARRVTLSPQVNEPPVVVQTENRYLGGRNLSGVDSQHSAEPYGAFFRQFQGS